MAKSASFAIAVLLLFTVSFAARPLVNEDTVTEFELGPAPAPLASWGRVFLPFIPELEDGPDALVPAQAPYESEWDSETFVERLEETLL